VARSFVGRVFVVVAGGSDLDAMFAVYAGFATRIDPPVATPVAVILAGQWPAGRDPAPARAREASRRIPDRTRRLSGSHPAAGHTAGRAPARDGDRDLRVRWFAALRARRNP